MKRRAVVILLVGIWGSACTRTPRETRADVGGDQTSDTGVRGEDDASMMLPDIPATVDDAGMMPPDDDAGTPPPMGLVYTNPPEGTGAVRLVAHESSTSTTVVLELVAARPLVGYFMGMSLPLDLGRVEFDPNTSFEVGNALNPGTAPAAVRALIARAGPRAGELSIGISQKASGAGAVPNDAAIPAGAVFFRLRLTAEEMAAPGLVVDRARIDAGLRDKNGTDVLRAADFAVGELRFY
jgi:hypothetical protein